ncbi:MAG: AI-2E family transporter [Defluviitaleaceae bacterium]|nr:AI-2E family transporter [Defluviitaleaceae bacterium]
MTKSQIIEKTKQLIPYFFLAVAVIIAFRLISSINLVGDAIVWTWGVISPFFYGFLMAYVINIPCGSVQRWLAKSKNSFVQRRQRRLSLFIVLLAALGILALTISFIIPAIRDSIEIFNYNLPTYEQNIINLIENIQNMGLLPDDIDPTDILGTLSTFFANFSFEDIDFWSFITGLGSTLWGAVIAFISSLYILVEKDKIKVFFKKILRVFTPKNTVETVGEVTFRLNKYFRQYVRTQTLDGLILGTMCTIALWIMGSPFALVLGIMLGIFNYVPMFGSIFGTILAILVVGFTQGLPMGLISAAVLIGIQQIDVHFVQPRLLGSSFKLSPLLIIISIIVGGAIAGILGMILAIPVLALLKDIFDSTVTYYERRKFGANSKSK